MLSIDPESCNHQPVYFGVININIDERTIGSVDVWRCGACKKKFCEEKQLGIEAISDTVGMPKIASDEKWGISVCKLQKGKDKWKLVKLKENGQLKHECLDEQIVTLQIKNYGVVDDDINDNGNNNNDNNNNQKHWSFLVDDNVNKAVEI